MTQNHSTNGASPQVASVKAQFQATLAPSSKAVSRKAWGIDVSTVWLPYFTAAKTVGAVDDVDLPDDALGAPFRLRRDKDTNEVRFSASGRPMFYVAPELNTLVNRARDNYVSSLIQQTAVVQEESPELFSAQIERQYKASAPILAAEDTDLAVATQKQQEAAMAEFLASQTAEEPTADTIADTVVEPGVAPEPAKPAGRKAS